MAAEKNKNHNTGIILLAAGASSRMGSPKQLLSFHGKTLLQHALDVAIESGNQPIVVVLGSGAAAMQHNTDFKTANIVVNKEWKEGMASSLRCGVATLLEINPSVEALILMVCDQPFATPLLIENLVRAHRESGKPIITCSYENTFGPPTLFGKIFFNALLQLNGDTGARAVINQHLEQVAIVPFPEGNLDIDTEDDYHRLRQKKIIS